MLRDRLLLGAYAAFVVGVSFLRDPLFLAFALTGMLGLALLGRAAVHLVGRTALLLLFFNGTLSVSYAAFSAWNGLDYRDTLLVINLRSAAITMATLLIFDRVPLVRAFSFSPELVRLAVLVLALSSAYRRFAAAARLSLQSRSPRAARIGDVYRHRASVAALLIRRAQADARQTLFALESREFEL